VLAVALGGAFGSVLRYGLTRLTVLWSGLPHWGTWCANGSGCLAIGLFTGYLLSGGVVSARQDLFVRAGCLGGLTTFSALALESVLLFESQRWGLAALHLGSHLLFGLGGVWVGLAIGRGWGG